MDEYTLRLACLDRAITVTRDLTPSARGLESTLLSVVAQDFYEFVTGKKDADIIRAAEEEKGHNLPPLSPKSAWQVFDIHADREGVSDEELGQHARRLREQVRTFY